MVIKRGFNKILEVVNDGDSFVRDYENAYQGNDSGNIDEEGR